MQNTANTAPAWPPGQILDVFALLGSSVHHYVVPGSRESYCGIARPPYGASVANHRPCRSCRRVIAARHRPAPSEEGTNPYRDAARLRKAVRLTDALDGANVAWETAADFGDRQWRVVAQVVGVNVPSEATRDLVTQMLAERERADVLREA